MEIKPNYKITLDQAEAKALTKLLGELSKNDLRQCGIDEDEITELSYVYGQLESVVKSK